MPGKWKVFFLQQDYHHLVKEPEDFPSLFCESAFRQIQNISTKQFYRTFLNINNSETSKVFTHFNQLYNIDRQQTSKLFTLPLRITIDTRLRITHYKILNNLIPTNEWLTKIGKKTDALCSFCNATPETLDHLFFVCPKIASFWNALRTRVTDFSPNYFLSRETVLFGLLEPLTSSTLAFNFLILLGKQFILRCKYQETLPSLKQFNYYLLSYKVTEEIIAKKKNKLSKHNVKWQNINKYFSIA